MPPTSDEIKKQREREAIIEDLKEWWAREARDEIDKMAPKAAEYGAYDLELIGEILGEMLGRDGLSRADKTELGIAFYVVGKTARVISAWRDGAKPSDDTWVDLSIYSRMALRTRAKGGWPA